jgi:hypothetical protein
MFIVGGRIMKLVFKMLETRKETCFPTCKEAEDSAISEIFIFLKA